MNYKMENKLLIYYMDIKYNNTYISGQFLTPQETKNKPLVSLEGLDTNKYYTLIMYDPNAVGGNHIHWIVTNIFGNKFETGNEILEYYGPHPPEGSNIHNYIFSLYESNKNVTNKMDPTKRQIELITILNMLNISGEPIYKKYFTSEYSGGKRKRRITKRRKNRKNKKTKRRRQ